MRSAGELTSKTRISYVAVPSNYELHHSLNVANAKNCDGIRISDIVFRSVEKNIRWNRMR